MVAKRAWHAGWCDDPVAHADPAWSESKKKSLHATEQTRPDVVAARQAWQAGQPCLSVGRLVFVDETWASTNMTPTRGRSLKGTRCIGDAPYGHWKTTTFLCGLRTVGLVAPLVIDGPINGELFRAWVEQMLVPALQPGDLVVLDNLRSHKVAGIEEAIRAAGAQLLYLPPYSPDYNPIEQVFSKLKPYLEKPPPAQSMTYGLPLANSLVNLLLTSACNISAIPAIAGQTKNALAQTLKGEVLVFFNPSI